MSEVRRQISASSPAFHWTLDVPPSVATATSGETSGRLPRRSLRRRRVGRWLRLPARSSLLRADPSLLFPLLLNSQVLRRCIKLNRRDQGHVEQLCAVFVIKDDQQSTGRINERMIGCRNVHSRPVASANSKRPIGIKSFAQCRNGHTRRYEVHRAPARRWLLFVF